MKTVFEKSYVCIDSEYISGTKVWAADGIRMYKAKLPEGVEILAADYPLGTKISFKLEIDDTEELYVRKT